MTVRRMEAIPKAMNGDGTIRSGRKDCRRPAVWRWLPALALLTGILIGCVGEVPEQIYADGRKAYENLDFREAEAKFSQFVEKYPDHEYVPPAYMWLAKTRVRVNDSTGAIEAFRKAAELAPEPGVRFESQVNLIQLYRHREEWDEALNVFQSLIGSTAGDNRKNFAIGYASTLWESGQVEAASKYLQAKAEETENPRYRAEYLLSLAELHITDENFNAAALVLTDIIKDASAPEQLVTAAYLWRGNALKDEGKTEAAQANYRELMERFPDTIEAVEAKVELAVLADEMDERERAAEYLRQATEEFSGRIRAATDDLGAQIRIKGRVARAYYRLERYEDALRVYREIQQLNPGNERLEQQVDAFIREVQKARAPKPKENATPPGEDG